MDSYSSLAKPDQTEKGSGCRVDIPLFGNVSLLLPLLDVSLGQFVVKIRIDDWIVGFGHSNVASENF